MGQKGRMEGFGKESGYMFKILWDLFWLINASVALFFVIRRIKKVGLKKALFE